MVTHKLRNPLKDNDAEIEWSQSIDMGILRICGINKGGVEQKVISIYASGRAYRHQNVGLEGLELDSKGRIKEYSTSKEAHNSHS